MDKAYENMIYIFYNEKPKNNYRRGVCRIWPTDEYFSFYMDPAPHEADGLFDIIEKKYLQDPIPIKRKRSDFEERMFKMFAEIDLNNNKKYRKGSRSHIANDRKLNLWRNG